MSDFWEEWRRNLQADHPEVRPDYRPGTWHEDFDRLRPYQDEHGNTHYPSTDFTVPIFEAGTPDGYQNKTDLLKRGWTRTAIRRILGEPDKRVPRVGLRPDRPECLYSDERVNQAERDGKVRFRKAAKSWVPTEKEFWEDGYVPRETAELGARRLRRAQMRLCVMRRARQRADERKARAGKAS